nr:MAG TPA: hypothetical protein [Bacteriophage sp.]
MFPCYWFCKSFASHISFAVVGKNPKNLSRSPL